MKEKTKFIIEAAMIAAIYAVVTILVAPIAYGPMQLRVSEAMCVLPFFTSAAVPGLFIGCLIANIAGVALGSSLGLMDVIVGSLATLFAAYAASKIKNKWIVPLPAVIINAFMVALTLYVMLGVPYWLNVAWVGIGQAISCYGFGMPLLFILEKNRKVIFER